MRPWTRRSFQIRTSASAMPPAAWMLKIAPGEPANHVATPVVTPSATSSARLQSVPRGVTSGRVYAGDRPGTAASDAGGATGLRHRLGARPRDRLGARVAHQQLRAQRARAGEVERREPP